MRVRDVFDEWPPSSGWVTSYGGFDRILPDFATDTIRSARADRDGLLTVAIGLGKREFHNSVKPKDSTLLATVAAVLDTARGKTLAEAGDLELG